MPVAAVLCKSSVSYNLALLTQVSALPLYQLPLPPQATMNFLSSNSRLEGLDCDLFPAIRLWIKRDDLLHPVVSGNKFRKLKYPLRHAQQQGLALASMGGLWSNHLHALAFASRAAGLASFALVRGHLNASKELPASLADCVAQGMQLRFVDRIAYRRLREENDYWKTWLTAPLPPMLWLPEGGSSPLAVQGMAELIAELDFIPEHIILPCGTGTSLAGLVAGLAGRSHVIGIACVNQASAMRTQVQELLAQTGFAHLNNFTILEGYEHGGFAKTSPALLAFCSQFTAQTSIELDAIYTGKMFYALKQLCEQNYFAKNSRVIAIHTGGLQGNRSGILGGK